MNEGGPLLIKPVSEEERREEERVKRGVREAEAATIHDLLSKERNPEGMLGALENAFGFAGTMTAKYRDPATPPIACCEGCSWCCYQTVLVSAPETFRLARFIRTEFSMEDVERVLARLRKLDSETRGATSTLRDRLRLSCAFLVDNRCSVYSARPLGCAEFTSFDVKACERAQRYGFDKVEIIHEKARMIMFTSVQQGVFDGLSRIEPPVEAAGLELTAAVLTALETPDCETRWLAGEKVFAKAHLVIGEEDFRRGPGGHGP